MGVDALLLQCGLDGRVDRGVEIVGGGVCSFELGLQNERVGPVIAMVDDAASLDWEDIGEINDIETGNIERFNDLYSLGQTIAQLHADKNHRAVFF